jgi:hypothetical protein
MKFSLFAAAALLAAGPLWAQAAGETPVPQVFPPNETKAADAPTTAAGDAGEPKVNQLIVYGDEPCPRSSADQITVCARKPERERYRIPENLRDLGTVKSQSWTSNAIELSYVGRTGTESCSTVGGGGFTGCLNQIINAASAEREGRDAVNWNALIEEARQARLGQIDAKTQAIEEDLKNNPNK